MTTRTLKTSGQHAELALTVSTTAAFDGGGRAVAEAMAAESELAGSSGFHVYSRYMNPTVARVEELIAELEHARSWAQLTASGMAAIEGATAPLIHALSPGDRSILVPSELYGGTLAWLTLVAKGLWGATVDLVDLDRPSPATSTDTMIEAILKRRPRIVLLETVTNPRLITLGIDRIAAAARIVEATVVVDNTFATSELVRPLDCGAHLVVNSATKYLSGHGSITAGVIAGRTDEASSTDGSFEAAVRTHVKLAGNILSPREAFELATQLRTFGLRMRSANSNARVLADFLARHPGIARVYYPGHVGAPGHHEACRLFGNRGFGAMVTIETARAGSAHRLITALDRAEIRYRTTLGDAETTILAVQPVFGADRFPDNAEMIRISVGSVERAEELIAKFGRALEQS